MRIRRALLALTLAAAFVGASTGVAAAEGGKRRDRCADAAAQVAKLQKEQQRLEARAQATSATDVRAQKLARRAQRLDAAAKALQTRCPS